MAVDFSNEDLTNRIDEDSTPTGQISNNAVDFTQGVRSSGAPMYGRETGTRSKYDEGISYNEAISEHGYESRRHESQGALASFGSALNQAIIGEIAGGFIEGVGYLADLPQYYRLAKGTEKEFGNWLSDFGTSIKEWTKEETPVYTDPTKEGQFSPEDWTWWMSNAPSVASSLALMIPSGAAIKGLSYLGKGMNTLVAGTKGARMMSKAALETMNATRKLAGLGEMTTAGIATAKKGAEWAAKGVGQATISRHMENMMEASGTHKQLYESLNGASVGPQQIDEIKRNYGIDLIPDETGFATVDSETANAIASRAASSSYNANWAMLLQDIPQYLTLRMPVAKSTEAMTAGVAKYLGKSFVATAKQKTAAVAADMLGEGFEEGYQYVVGERSRENALADAGLAKRRSLGDAIHDYAGDGDFWTSAVFGMLGAGVMQAAGSGLSNIKNRVKGVETENQARILNLQETGERMKNYLQAKTIAETKGNQALIDKVDLDFKIALGLEAAQHGNLDYVIDMLEASENMTPEEAKSLNLPENYAEFAKKKDPNLIKELKELGEMYDKNVVAYGPYFASKITEQQFTAKSRGKDAADKLSTFNEQSENWADDGRLSGGYKRAFQIKNYHIPALEVVLDGLQQVYAIASTQKDDVMKEYYEGRIKKTQEQIAELNKEHTESLRNRTSNERLDDQVYEGKVTKAQKKQGSKTVNAVHSPMAPQSAEAVQSLTNSLVSKEVQDRALFKAARYSDPTYQKTEMDRVKKKESENLKTNVANASTSAEIKKQKADAARLGTKVSNMVEEEHEINGLETIVKNVNDAREYGQEVDYTDQINALLNDASYHDRNKSKIEDDEALLEEFRNQEEESDDWSFPEQEEQVEQQYENKERLLRKGSPMFDENQMGSSKFGAELLKKDIAVQKFVGDVRKKFTAAISNNKNVNPDDVTTLLGRLDEIDTAEDVDDFLVALDAYPSKQNAAVTELKKATGVTMQSLHNIAKTVSTAVNKNTASEFEDPDTIHNAITPSFITNSEGAEYNFLSTEDDDSAPRDAVNRLIHFFKGSNGKGSTRNVWSYNLDNVESEKHPSAPIRSQMDQNKINQGFYKIGSKVFFEVDNGMPQKQIMLVVEVDGKRHVLGQLNPKDEDIAGHQLVASIRKDLTASKLDSKEGVVRSTITSTITGFAARYSRPTKRSTPLQIVRADHKTKHQAIGGFRLGYTKFVASKNRWHVPVQGGESIEMGTKVKYAGQIGLIMENIFTGENIPVFGYVRKFSEVLKENPKDKRVAAMFNSATKILNELTDKNEKEIISRLKNILILPKLYRKDGLAYLKAHPAKWKEAFEDSIPNIDAKKINTTFKSTHDGLSEKPVPYNEAISDFLSFNVDPQNYYTGASVLVAGLEATEEVAAPAVVVKKEIAKEKVVEVVDKKKDIEAKKADIERRRQEELNQQNKRISTKSKTNRKGLNVGDKFDIGYNALVESNDIPFATLTEEEYNKLTPKEKEEYQNNPYDIVIEVLEDAKFDSNGKLLKAPVVKTASFKNKEEADRFLAEREISLNKALNKAKDKVSAKYDAELAALESVKSQHSEQKQPQQTDSLNGKIGTGKTSGGREVTGKIYKKGSKYTITVGKTTYEVVGTPVVASDKETKVVVAKDKKTQAQAQKFTAAKAVKDEDKTPELGAKPAIESGDGTQIQRTSKRPAKSGQGHASISAEAKIKAAQANQNDPNIKRFKLAGAPVENWYKEDQVDWFYENFNGVPLHVVDGLRFISKNGPELWGSFVNGAVYIAKKATAGTVYHEAFHVVFNMYLGAEEARKVVDRYAKDKNLKTPVTEAEIIAIEERMADEFEEYMATHKNAKPKGWLQEFFDWLLDIIGFVSIHRSEILYDRIATGFFKEAQVKPGIFGSIVQRNKPAGWSAKFQKESTEVVNQTIIFEVIPQLQQLGEIPDGLNTAEALDFCIKNDKMTMVYGSVYDVLSDVYDTLEESDEKANLDRLLDEYYNEDMSFGKMINMSILGFDYYNGIKISKKMASTTINDENQDDEMSEDEKSFKENWMSSATKRSAGDNVPQQIKDFLRYLKRPGYKNSFGLDSYVDFNDTFNKLLLDTAGSTSVGEMKSRLRKIYDSGKMGDQYVGLNPEYLEVLNRLDADKVFASKFFNAFSKQHAIYTVIVKSKNGSYDVIDANRTGVANKIITDWKSAVSFESKVVSTTAEGEEVIDTQLAKELLKEFNEIINNRDLYTFNRLSQIASDFGMKIPVQTFIYADETSGDLSYNYSIKNPLFEIFKRFTEGQNPFNPAATSKEGFRGEMKLIRRVAEVVKYSTPSLYESSFRNIENSTVYSHIVPNFISTLVSRLTNRDSAESVIESYFKDSFYYNNPILEEIGMSLANKEIKLSDVFSVSILDGMREGNKKTWHENMNEADRLSMALNLFYNNGNANYAKYVGPTLSDSPNILLFGSNKYETEVAINKLRLMASSEYKRIQSQLELANKEGLNKVEFYNTVDPSYIMMPMFNGFKGDPGESKNQIKANKLIEKWIASKTIELKSSLVENGVISIDEATGKFGKENRLHEDMLVEESFDVNLANFVANDFLNAMAVSTLTVGDPAFYKPNKGSLERDIDYYKRAKEIYSPKFLPDIDAEFVTEEGEIIYAGSEYMTAYIHDAIESAPSFQSIKRALETAYPDGRFNDILENYKKVNQTDGQAYISLPFYRRTMISLGRWDNSFQKAYDNLIVGQGTADDVMKVMQPIKPFTYGLVFNEEIGRLVPTQNKNSEFLLLPQFAKATNEDGTFKNPKLAMLYDKMNDSANPIDVVNFHSAVKVGGSKITTIEELNPTHSHALAMENRGIQVETPEHFIDAMMLFGTQIRKLIMANLDKTGTPYMVGGKLSMQADALHRMYEDILLADLIESYDDVKKEFLDKDGNLDKAKISNILLDESRSRGKGEEYEKAIELNEDGEFNLPLFHPLHARTSQSLLNSIFRNRVTKQKIKGGGLIQASSFGFSESLKLVYDEKTGGLLHAEILLPAWSQDFFNDFPDGKGGVDFEKAKATLPAEIFEMIGYRIPTEDKYSMLPLKVVGFLPIESGGAVMLPVEITTIAGSDFDVDTLKIMMKSFKRTTTLNLDKIADAMNAEILKQSDGKQEVDLIEPYEIAEALGLRKRGEALSGRDQAILNFFDSVKNNPKTVTKKVNKIKNLEKPNISVIFVKNEDLFNTEDHFGNKESNDLLKKRYDQLEKLLNCIG